MLHRGRDWCASVLQSHASHPSLIYFRSVGTGAGWPATLGALMDLALIFELLVDDRAARAPAVLLRLVDEINGLLGLEPGKDETTSADGLKLCAALGRRLRLAVTARCRRVRGQTARARKARPSHRGASRHAERSAAHPRLGSPLFWAFSLNFVRLLPAWGATDAVPKAVSAPGKGASRIRNVLHGWTLPVRRRRLPSTNAILGSRK